MKKKHAFTLIELLIAVSILSLFFVLAISVTIVSLKNMKIKEHKILATYYAEEAKEWLTHLKENDWIQFKNKVNNSYCFNNLPNDYNWIVEDQNNCQFSIDNFYKRLVSVSSDVIETQLNVKITVWWQENNRDYKVDLPLIFTVWEK